MSRSNYQIKSKHLIITQSIFTSRNHMHVHILLRAVFSKMCWFFAHTCAPKNYCTRREEERLERFFGCIYLNETMILLSPNDTVLDQNVALPKITHVLVGLVKILHKDFLLNFRFFRLETNIVDSWIDSLRQKYSARLNFVCIITIMLLISNSLLPNRYFSHFSFSMMSMSSIDKIFVVLCNSDIFTWFLRQYTIFLYVIS